MAPSRRKSPLPPLLWAVLLLCPAQAWAIGEWEKGGCSLQASGALRLTGAFLHFPDAPALFAEGDDGLAASVSRLLFQGELGERVSYEANLYLELTRAPASSTGGALATVGTFTSPYRYRHLAWDFWDSGSMAGQLGIDRLALTLHLKRTEIVLGRAPINHSVTMLFSPNDFFAPFSATAINKIYKPGVDALRINFAAGPMTSLSLAAVPGSEAGGDLAWGRTALVARAATVRWGFEWAVLGGKLAERWVVGASLQGEAGPVGLRAEGHAGLPDRDADGVLDGSDADQASSREIHGRVAAGVERRFEWRNLSLSLEGLYQSDGGLRPALYLKRLGAMLPDDLPWLGQLYLGLTASGEITPLLKSTALVMVNTQDGSGLALLSVGYSLSDEAEFAGGLLVPWGEEPVPLAGSTVTAAALQSEMGLYPLMVFLETRFYF